MTVRCLIELLQALPQDLPVHLGDWSEGYAADIPIDHVDEGHEDDGPQLLPRVAVAFCAPPKWNHPKRVVIGG